MKKKETNEYKDELVKKFIDLALSNSIMNSNLYLELLDSQRKFYQYQLGILKENKPLFFQKNRLKDYYKKVDEYMEKIGECCKKIGEEEMNILEIKEIIGLYNSHSIDKSLD